MAITTQIINDNQYIYEAVIIGSASGDSTTINVSDLQDAIAIDGVEKQRLNISLNYSLDPSCEMLVEFATGTTGSFSGIESGIPMEVSGPVPTTTVDSTVASVTQSSTTGSGSAATFDITSSGGSIVSVTSVSEGNNYADGNTITFTAADLTSLSALGTVTGNLVVNVVTGAKQWKAYGTNNIIIKNTIVGSNGDIRITFSGAAGCCKVSAIKTEGFRLASPYYRKVSGRRA